MRRERSVVAILGVLSVMACDAKPADSGKQEQGVLAERDARVKAALARPGTGSTADAPIARWVLPRSLKEVSGLALTVDDRLLAHDDSHGRVVEIDYRRGKIVKQFTLAPDPGKVDFEGITVAGESVFMIASDGKLYEFKEGKDGETVSYVVHDTKLGAECEFEGVAYDPATLSLLMACKVVKIPALRDSVVIYRWKLGAALAPALRLSRLTVAASAIALKGGKVMNPSDITVDAKAGTYVIISAREKAFIEITPAGVVVASHTLSGKHPQAEGIAITKDGILIISDEAASGPAAITLYRRP